MTGDQAGAIRVWDLRSEHLITQFGVPEGPVYRLRALVSPGSGGALLRGEQAGPGLLLIDEQAQVTRLLGHTAAIYALDIQQ